MNWKLYKALPKAQKNNEIYYMLGLDIGNDSSSIAYFNVAANTPEIIDLSGGYGKPSIPTVMQYIAETNEKVFGEYAILNRGMGREIILSALIEKLGSNELVDLDGKLFKIFTLLGDFIKEMVSSVKNINPKAEIVGIVAAVPSYLSEQARDELTRAFQHAGFGKELIGLTSDRECVFSHYYLTRTPREERGLLLDYGSREVRGCIYHVIPKGTEIEIKIMSSLFDDAIGTQKINESVCDMCRDFYADHLKTTPRTLNKTVQEQIYAFVFQHKDMLFQKNIRTKPVKLYFNFAYPPFQQTVDYAQIERMLRPYSARFNRFMQDVLAKNLYEHEEISPADIDTVLCVGGGFEMLWTRDAVTRLFPRSKIQFYKNAKIITAEGAATVAARLLQATDTYTVTLDDRHQLREDIGLTVWEKERERFHPLAERNAFWWQKHPARLFIVNTPCDGAFPIQFAARDANGETRTLAQITLEGLPVRPKGVTRLSVQLHFISNNEMTATVRDYGFGELFPKTDYERVVTLLLNN